MTDGQEDAGSRTVEDAARFERWRSKHYDPPADGDPRPGPRYYMGTRVPTRCTCHSRSEEPCDFCSWPGEES